VFGGEVRDRLFAVRDAVCVIIARAQRSFSDRRQGLLRDELFNTPQY
jgi:hypothetical protein